MQDVRRSTSEPNHLLNISQAKIDKRIASPRPSAPKRAMDALKKKAIGLVKRKKQDSPHSSRHSLLLPESTGTTLVATSSVATSSKSIAGGGSLKRPPTLDDGLQGLRKGIDRWVEEKVKKAKEILEAEEGAARRPWR